jgi:hypothetical protein
MDDTEDVLLLAAREAGDALEGFTDLADGAAAADGRGVLSEEVFYADAQSGGHFREDLGARRLVGELPEGDVSLRHPDQAPQLFLCEAGGQPEVPQARALGGSAT